MNGTLGMTWRGGRIVTTLRAMNLFNEKVQQHVFGDILTRQVIGEVKLRFE